MELGFSSSRGHSQKKQPKRVAPAEIGGRSLPMRGEKDRLVQVALFAGANPRWQDRSQRREFSMGDLGRLNAGDDQLAKAVADGGGERLRQSAAALRAKRYAMVLAVPEQPTSTICVR